jgi:hypothetical protein
MSHRVEFGEEWRQYYGAPASDLVDLVTSHFVITERGDGRVCGGYIEGRDLEEGGRV